MMRISVQNAADYFIDRDRLTGVTRSGPGLARSDVDPDGKECTTVSIDTDVASMLCPKLSTVGSR